MKKNDKVMIRNTRTIPPEYLDSAELDKPYTVKQQPSLFPDLLVVTNNRFDWVVYVEDIELLEGTDGK